MLLKCIVFVFCSLIFSIFVCWIQVVENSLQWVLVLIRVFHCNLSSRWIGLDWIGLDWAGFNISTNTVKVIQETVLQVKRPNQQHQSTEGKVGQPQTGRCSKPTRGFPPCYEWTSEKRKTLSQWVGPSETKPHTAGWSSDGSYGGLKATTFWVAQGVLISWDVSVPGFWDCYWIPNYQYLIIKILEFTRLKITIVM